MIEELLERQEILETKLSKMEAVMMFDDKDLEAQTGIKSVIETPEDQELYDEILKSRDASSMQPSLSSLAATGAESPPSKAEEEKAFSDQRMEKYEVDLLKVDE